MRNFSGLCIMTMLLLLPLCRATGSVPAYKGDGVGGLRSSYDECLDEPNNWHDCISAEYKYQDARLNRLYKALMVKLSEIDRTSLRAEEKAWISDRDTQCVLDIPTSLVDTSDKQTLPSNDCAVELTAKRANVLDSAISSDKTTLPALVAQIQAIKKNDLQVFATNGAQILDYQIGFLDGSDIPGALVVIDPPKNGNKGTIEGIPRIVLILIRNSAGKLQQVQQNNKIVPCEKCGGMHGDDPFTFMRIAKNRFSVTTGGGGASDRWSNTYVFKYSVVQKDWLLNEVQRGVFDTSTHKNKKIILTTKNFGQIKFEKFDPSALPNVDL